MEYNISKGNFSSGIHFGLHTGRVSQTYKVRFDSSCLYTDIDWERDWNKLVGWSYSNLPFKNETTGNWDAPHHNNSVRLVWRANKEKGVIELGFYYYMDKIRTIIELCEVPIDKDLILSIIIKGRDVTCIVVCKETNLYVIKPIFLLHAFKAIWSYKLFPYFGGSNPAPHDISLSITEA